MKLFKRPVAALVAAAVLAASALPSGASAAYAFESGRPKASKELRALASSEAKVLKALDSAVNAELKKIRDPKTRKTYADLAKTKRAGMKSVFSDIRSEVRHPSYVPVDTGNLRDAVRLSAKSALELADEIRQVAENGSAAVSESERARVESNVVAFQRELFSSPVRSVLDTYLKDGVKETGDSRFSADTPYGTVNVSVDRYASVLSMVGLAQETDFVISGDFDLQVPGPTRYHEETFEPVSGGTVDIKGSVKFDANVKVVDSTAYVLLRDYALGVSVSGSGSESAQKEIDSNVAQTKAVLDKMKGKTVSIEMPEDEFASSDLTPQEVLAKFREVLSVLDTSSLFTPERKISGSSYALGLNPKTVAKIAAVFGERVSKGEFDRENREVLASGLTYDEFGDTVSISAIDPAGEGTFELSKASDGYSLKLRTLSPRERGLIEITPEGATVRMSESSGSFSADWNRATGALEASAKERDGETLFTVTGTALLNRVDLAVNVGGKTVATLKIAKTGTTTESNLWISFDVPPLPQAQKNSVTITASGKSTLESGSFTVEVPTDSVDIEALIGDK